MLRGFSLGAGVLVAAAAAAGLLRPAPAASAPAPEAAPRVLATSQGWIGTGISAGDGAVTIDGSGAPAGLEVTVALLQAGHSWPVTNAIAGEDGRFHAKAAIPNGVQSGQAATIHVCYALAARNIDFCSDSAIEVPPVPRAG